MVGDKVWIRQDSIPYTFDLLTELFYNQYGNRIPLVQVKDTLRGVLFNNLFSQLPELYALMEAQNSVMMARIKDNGFGETYVQSGSDTTSRVGNVKQVGDRVNIDSTSDNEHAYDYETEGTFRDSINSGKSSSDQNSKSDQTVTYGKQTTKTTSRVFEYLSDAQIGGLIIKWLENFNPLFQTIAAQNANCISPGLAEFIQLNFSWSYITGVPNDNGAFVSYMKDFRSYLASTYMPKFWIDSNAEYGLYWDRDQLNRPVLRAAISQGVVTELTEEVKKQAGRIRDVELGVQQASDAILNLTPIVDANQKELEDLRADHNDLQNQVITETEDLQGQINQTNEQVAENASNINQNSGEIETLRNDLGDLGNIQNRLIQELQKVIDQVAKGQILHIEGPYSADKTYAAGALVIGKQQGTESEYLWLSLQDNNTGNPLVDDSSYWYRLLRTGDINISLNDYYNKTAIDTMLTQYATVGALQALNAVVNQNKTDITNLTSRVSTLDGQVVKTSGNQTVGGNKTFSGETTMGKLTVDSRDGLSVKQGQIHIGSDQHIKRFDANNMAFEIGTKRYCINAQGASAPTDIVLKGNLDGKLTPSEIVVGSADSGSNGVKITKDRIDVNGSTDIYFNSPDQTSQIYGTVVIDSGDIWRYSTPKTNYSVTNKKYVDDKIQEVKNGCLGKGYFEMPLSDGNWYTAADIHDGMNARFITFENWNLNFDKPYPITYYTTGDLCNPQGAEWYRRVFIDVYWRKKSNGLYAIGVHIQKIYDKNDDLTYYRNNLNIIIWNK